MLTGISMEALLEALEQVPPHEPKMAKIGREYRVTGQMPSELDRTNAIQEQMAYGKTCERFAGNIRNLTAVPVLLEEISETYPL